MAGIAERSVSIESDAKRNIPQIINSYEYVEVYLKVKELSGQLVIYRLGAIRENLHSLKTQRRRGA